MKKAVLTGLVLIILNGCNTLTTTNVHRPDPLQYLTHAGYQRDLETVIIGNLPSHSRSQLEKMVIDSLVANYGFVHANFTTTPSKNHLAPYKIIFVFNAAQQSYSDDFCAGKGEIERREPSKKLFVTAIFCEKSAITDVAAYVDYHGKDKALNLAKAIDDLAQNLVPSENEIDIFNYKT